VRSLLDSTLPYLAGPRTLAALVVPAICAAAAAAGRPAPWIAAGVPACVTTDPEGARAHAFDYLGGNARNASYQAVLERDGATAVKPRRVIGPGQHHRAVVLDLDMTAGKFARGLHRLCPAEMLHDGFNSALQLVLFGVSQRSLVAVCTDECFPGQLARRPPVVEASSEERCRLGEVRHP
jgi:hypothetical protein